MKPSGYTMMLVLLAACAVCACTRKAAESGAAPVTQLSCEGTTYRVSADGVDGEVNAACERANKSAEAVKAYQATVSRFTCQESDGHVITSILAPGELFDEYSESCRQYLAAQEAFHNRTMDFAAHRVASDAYHAKSNELARRYGEHYNALFRERKSDQAALSRLIKNRGGSIEITN